MSSSPSPQPPSAVARERDGSTPRGDTGTNRPPPSKLEEIEREIGSLRRENQVLRTRLLGVNELARLLQEKTESYENLHDKTRRQEVAIIRLENRCSNYDKKLRQATIAGGTGGVVKSNQSPFIPGPSRQILEGLMKENSGLKKAINNVIKKSESGYLEAVKLTQLEEVIDQKSQEVDFMKSQIATLTAHTSDESWLSSPGALQRQLLKQQQSMKAKDRFCGLLSDQVQQLQQQLEEAKGSRGKDDSGYTSQPQDTMLQKLDELQHQLEQEMKEKSELTQNSTSKLSALESENDNLKSRVDDLNSYNDTLLEEKGQLNATIADLKMGESKLVSMEQTIQAVQMRHSAELDTKQQDIRALQNDLDKANMQIATMNSLLAMNRQPSSSASSDKHIRDLNQQLKNMADEKDYWQGHAERLSRQMQDFRQRQQQAYYSQHSVPSLVAGGAHTPILTASQHMHGGIAVRDSPRPAHPHTEPLRSSSCGTNALESTTRTSLLVRDTGSEPEIPVTTASITHVPPGTLGLNTQPTGLTWSTYQPTNAAAGSIPSPSRYVATPHPMTPSYRPPPPPHNRMNSAESGYHSGLPSGFSSMGSTSSPHPSMSGSLGSSSIPTGYSSSSLPHGYPHSQQQQQQQQQQYDGAPQGQPLPPRSSQGSPRYQQYDPQYYSTGRRGHQ